MNKPQKPLEPKEFRYDARRLRWARAFAYIAASFYLCLLPSLTILRHPGVYRELGLWLFIAMLATTLAVGASMAAVIYFAAVTRTNDGLHRVGQRIRVDEEGIFYTDGDRTIRSAWQDITAVRLTSLGHWAVGIRRIVVTPYGEFDYTLSISNAKRLDASIKRCAVNAAFTAESLDDGIGSQAEIPGVCVYHYRNHTNRALLMFPLGFVLIAIVIGVLQAFGLTDGSPAKPWVVGFGSLAVWGWFFWRFRTVSVRTDSLGITWMGPNRRIFIPWTDVLSALKVGGDQYTFLVVKGSRNAIRIWIGINRFPALEQEIQSHISGRNGYNIM